MWTTNGKIAFFDSGIGGLTVVNECRKYLPYTDFYYYGDNQHAPYGNLSEEKIKEYVLKAFEVFEKLGVGAAVVACNTVTAVAIEELREKFSFPIIGAEPAVIPGMRAGGEVYVLTTRATYNSCRFQELCKKARFFFPEANLKLFPCDKLAGEIEQHIFERDFDYVPLLPNGTPSAVVLGCTHYIYIARQIKEFYQCSLFDGNTGIANRLLTVLREDISFYEHLQPPSNHFQPFLDGDYTKKVGGEVAKRGEIIFLGGHGKHNKRVYEQMFG